jgi:hypothetical protein
MVQTTGANPTTVSYNASVVKIYNTTNSIPRFSKKTFFPYLKRCSLPQRLRWSCKFRSRRIGSRISILFLLGWRQWLSSFHWFNENDLGLNLLRWFCRRGRFFCRRNFPESISGRWPLSVGSVAVEGVELVQVDVGRPVDRSNKFYVHF